MIDELRKVIKRLHYPLEVMLVCVRWYAAYPLSLRNLEEMMSERGVVVDHTTVHRWAIRMLPVLALMLRRRKRPVGLSWRMDETYVKVGGQWKYLYRAVDKAGQTIDFLLRAHRPAWRSREDHHRQERRKHGGDRGHPRRLRRRHRDAAIEVPQQPDRTRPPCCQAHRAPHARI